MAAKKDFSISDYIVHGVYFTLYGLVKYFPAPLGNILRYWVSKPFLKKIGKCRIGEGCTIWYPYRIEIGDDVTLNEFIYISGYGSIVIEDGVRMGTRTTIITSDHKIGDRNIPIRNQGLVAGAVTIKEDVWIGCNVTVLKGVTIGKGAVIAAGAVVTGDIPEFAIAGGVPAKILRIRD